MKCLESLKRCVDKS